MQYNSLNVEGLQYVSMLHFCSIIHLTNSLRGWLGCCAWISVVNKLNKLQLTRVCWLSRLPDASNIVQRRVQQRKRSRTLAKCPHTCNTNFGERSLCWTGLRWMWQFIFRYVCALSAQKICTSCVAKSSYWPKNSNYFILFTCKWTP